MKSLAVAVLLVLCCGARAELHQLDEYVQAALLDLARGRDVSVDLSLTPGALIATDVLAVVDRDGDGAASPSEVAEYARRVMQDLRLTIDGRPYSLTTTRAVSSAWDELNDGTGSIRIAAVAEGAVVTEGAHRIVFENTHRPAPSVYLVNALKPDHDVVISAQRRDALQHRIELDVDVSGPRTRVVQFGVGSALIFALVTLRSGFARRSNRRLPGREAR